jgi:hypothetical protein
MRLLNLVPVLTLLLLVAACQDNSESQTLQQSASSSSLAPVLGKGPTQSCKQQEEEFRFGSSGGAKKEALPKSRQYLEAMFQEIVKRDAQHKQPLFRGRFSQDRFCIAVDRNFGAPNAFAYGDSGLIAFTPEFLLQQSDVTNWFVMSHEIAHILLGHGERFPHTTFPVEPAEPWRRLNQEAAHLVHQIGSKLSIIRNRFV